jgi:hypothetical protein
MIMAQRGKQKKISIAFFAEYHLPVATIFWPSTAPSGERIN